MNFFAHKGLDQKVHDFESSVRQLKRRRVTHSNLSMMADYSNHLLEHLDESLDTITHNLQKLQLEGVAEQDEAFRRIKLAFQDVFLFTHKIKLFSYSEKHFERDFDLTQCIKECAASFSLLLDHNIEFKLHIDNQIAHMQGSYALLKTLMNHLLINAEEAIQAVGGVGNIDVWVKRYRQQQKSVDSLGKTMLKRGVHIEIIDNGCGIHEDISATIFNPFVSYKEAHEGLGLAVVFGIVNAHGGNIKLVSKHNYGSAFSIFLPVN